VWLEFIKSLMGPFILTHGFRIVRGIGFRLERRPLRTIKEEFVSLLFV
jgi:hypothetical protein